MDAAKPTTRNANTRTSTSCIERRAMRLLVALARARSRGVTDPIPAIALASAIGIADSHSHESKRRRVREAVKHAREMLRAQDAEECLVADGRGYWITFDAADLRAYLGRRKRAGLTHLAEHGRTERSIAADHAGGQGVLFDLSGRSPSSCAM